MVLDIFLHRSHPNKTLNTDWKARPTPNRLHLSRIGDNRQSEYCFMGNRYWQSVTIADNHTKQSPIITVATRTADKDWQSDAFPLSGSLFLTSFVYLIKYKMRQGRLFIRYNNEFLRQKKVHKRISLIISNKLLFWNATMLWYPVTFDLLEVYGFNRFD